MVLDCLAKTVTLAMLGVPLVIWQGAVSHESIGIISYICARGLISRGCKSDLTYICDTNVESPLLDYVPIVCMFFDVFPCNAPILEN